MRAPLLRRKPSEGVRGPKSLSPSAQPILVQLCPPFKRRRHRTERRAGRLAVAAEVGGVVVLVVRETNPVCLRSRGRTAGSVLVTERDDGGAEEETAAAAHADGRDGRTEILPLLTLHSSFFPTVLAEHPHPIPSPPPSPLPSSPARLPLSLLLPLPSKVSEWLLRECARVNSSSHRQ